MISNDKRIRIIIGHYGSGKSEFAMNYVTKLMSAGFEYNAELTVDEKEAYSKECVINGETKTVVVKVYLAEDYLSGSQFLIYPSVL